MAIKKIVTQDLIQLLKTTPVFDVRSPAEFLHAHIPGSHSLPLFSDQERAEVGTLYKQKGKTFAVKQGLDFFGPKMKPIIEQVELILKQLKKQNSSVIVHCWRGGMRSAGVAWLLDLYGFDVFILVGGYKAYRSWVLEQFSKPYEINVLGGFTGSAKTEILTQLQSKGQSIIDLEGLAHHKGSAFGGLGQPQQPTQEMFENKLALELYYKNKNSFWLEDESQRIGVLNIPHQLWATIRKNKILFIDIPFDERLELITKQYGVFPVEKLTEAVLRIQKRFGPNETKMTIAFLAANNIKAAFELLLRYYDREYDKSMHKRENLELLLKKITSSTTDVQKNAITILQTISNQ